VNEFELAKLTPRASQRVKPPRVGESAVSFECKVYQILDFSSPPHGGSLVIGEIVSIHVDEKHMKDGHLDPTSLDLIGRMGGNQYSRTTERFEMVRPKTR
jgi:flavin reductase (DIM6/NTAB) family NADH-FMN oxidoreductase RutF